MLFKRAIDLAEGEEEFVFLAVILDAYSRRVIGWELDRTPEDRLTLAALRMAFGAAAGEGKVDTPLRSRSAVRQRRLHSEAHHQYEPESESLGQPSLRVVHEALKWEEVYRCKYRGLQDARPRIGEFLEKVYNERRPHSALGYLSPVEFERGHQAEQKKAGVARIAFRNQYPVWRWRRRLASTQRGAGIKPSDE